MVKILDSNNKLVFRGFFPKKFPKSRKKQRVLIGIGGNVGNSFFIFKKLVRYLINDIEIDIVRTSPILINPPFGYREQQDFKNAVLVIKTNLTPDTLMKKLLYIEKKFGRKRLFKDGPRTLDLDIIFFENKTVYNKNLTIPHPQWNKRNSVLIPLCYL